MSNSPITPDGPDKSSNIPSDPLTASIGVNQLNNVDSTTTTPTAHPHRVSFSDSKPVSTPNSRKPSLLRKASLNNVLPHDLENKQRPILSNSNSSSTHSIHKIDTSTSRPNHIAIYQNNNTVDGDLKSLDKTTLSPSATNGKHFNLTIPPSRSRDKSPAGSISGSSRSRSSSNKLHSSATGANSSHSNSLYVAQEKAYLRKMRNQQDNDYYS